jgi:MFS family permease
VNWQRDIAILFGTRIVRLLAYGSLSVILVLYLSALGFPEPKIGLLLTLTLIGDTIVSLWLTTRADRFGRRRTLAVGAILMVMAGAAFAFTDNFWILLTAATIGVISPSGNEVGPFLSIEQAALSQIVSAHDRTRVFAWYTLVGAFATACGSLIGGLLVSASTSMLTGYRTGIVLYALLGLVLLLFFARLSAATEVVWSKPSESQASLKAGGWYFGVKRSRGVVLRLAALFMIDAFGGGFVIQSLAAYWLYVRFGIRPAALGGIFFGANLLAGVSALAATKLASRFGLINTMVFTHLPSNILLILVPLMPNLPLAIAVLLLRFSISQMDVPTRQSYVMAVVPPEERSAAAGITRVARTIGAAISPLLAGIFFANPSLIDLPFYFAGGLKIVYDLLLYRSFITHRPPEESSRSNQA